MYASILLGGPLLVKIKEAMADKDFKNSMARRADCQRKLLSERLKIPKPILGIVSELDCRVPPVAMRYLMMLGLVSL